jgi:EAL domain-containing protein (putative c-di-GMP-specific phosphodiesterase class I)/GGDEF domain-containing protein/DNA-binding NarL/FixJ family response regulator
MARKNTIRLLLINGSDNDTELVVSLFRSAGRVARAQRVNSADDLAKALQQPWDLLIADDNHPDLKVESCLEHLRQLQADFPILVQRDSTDLGALFAAGATDIIASTDDQRLIGAALRELDNLDERRSIAKLRRQLQEAEQRNALLLGETDQALAYVTDGMVINANALFAERFGYGSADELDCAPVVDLLAATDLEGFKAALKNNLEGEFACTGQSVDGATFHARVCLRNATYDDDPCTQLIVTTQAATAEAGSSGNSDLDTDTGLFSRAYLLDQIERRDSGWLVMLQLQGFADLRREIGLSSSVELAVSAAEFITDHNPFGPCCIARIADDCFAALIEGGSSERLLEQAKGLCAGVNGHRFAQALSIQAGIVSCAGDSAVALLDAAFAASAKADAKHHFAYLHRTASAPRKSAQTQGDNSALLEDALHEQRFTLLFQPIISLRGASGEHYEALLRMHGSNNALELPDNFIDSLGVSADNAKLDRWVLLEATKELAANRARGNDTRLIINLTASALQDEALTGWLGVALKAAGLPASSLILQLREADVLSDPKAAKAFAEAVRQIGCQIAISGFGRMQDVEKTLRNLPTDLVQLDGSFTRALLTSGDMEPIKTLVTAANSLDVKTIVPFVENASVLATLWQVGADFIQGHYLQAPSAEMNYEFSDIA